MKKKDEKTYRKCDKKKIFAIKLIHLISFMKRKKKQSEERNIY